MVDIHSHILPGVDDGSRSMEESIEMVRMAAAAGTTDIVATPHADGHYRYHPGLVRKLIADLQVAVGSDIRIHQGCDFHLFYPNIEDALLNPTRYTVNERCYLMVELDDAFIHTDTDEYFAKLEGAGMRIVLTHPERNPILRHQPERIEQWVAAGRYMQVTAQSLLGRFGPAVVSFSQRLLDRGLVHFIASDAHDLRDRRPVLDEAWGWVSTRYSEALAQCLFRVHPRAVIEGTPIDLSGFPPKKKSLWSRLLGRNA